MRALFSFLLASLLLTVSLPARGFPQRLAAIYLGGTSLDLRDLNRLLSDENMQTLDSDNLCFGGFGAGQLGDHLLLGFEAGGFWQKERSDSLLMRLSGVEAFIDAGYLLHLGERIKAYPLVGVGLGWTMFKLIPDYGTLSFHEVLSNPHRISKLTSSGLLLNFGMGAHWLVYQRMGEYRTENWYIGLRVGYKYMPSPSDWSMEDLEISGGPEVSLSGPYLHFYLGWGPEAEEEHEPFFPGP
jgi:hypothetical protein